MKIKFLTAFIAIFSGALIYSQSVSVANLNNGCVSYADGELGLNDFLMKNLKYPSECIDMAVEGLVIVKITVDKEGKATNHKIGLGRNPLLDEEALRLSKLIEWTWEKTCYPESEEVLLPLQFSMIESYEESEWPETAEEAPSEEDNSEGATYSAHWAGIESGLGFLMNDNQSLYPYWNASEVNYSSYALNFLEYKLPIAKQYLGLTTGLGFNVNSIFMNQYDLVHTTGMNTQGNEPDTVFAVQNNILNYRRNNFNFVTFTMPILIEICSKAKSKKSFYLDFGAVGYWNFGRSWETAGKLPNGDRFQHQVNGPFQMARLGAYATLRTGFDNYGLFANYSLTPLFKKDATGMVYPLTFGISVNLDY